MIENGTNIWQFSIDHTQPCQIIDAQTLWGETTYRVWLPESDAVVRVNKDSLVSLETAEIGNSDNISYIAAAGRVADILTEDILLAPIESAVIPLPHQINALQRAISGDRVRYLLADEVGLGKTIEAGLIIRELKLRGLVNRTLVVAPKGLVTQWAAEMDTHFNEEFRILIPGDFGAYRKIASTENLWQSHPQVICPLDSVKPLDSRKGWSNEQVADYNRERFEDLISAGWDLVIVDEAHRLGGSTDQVARYKLGQGLAEAAPYLLLLSATPHQGKTDAFHRLISLLDSQEFPDVSSINRDRVAPYVIRTEKRHAIDAEGLPLFKPRKTKLFKVKWSEKHKAQLLLYEAVTEYVRLGYNQAIKNKRSYIGFLMILMQRLVVSSTQAIKATLKRRLEVLTKPQEQLLLFPIFSEDDWADLDGQEQVDVLLGTQLKALKNERAEVKLLLEAAARCEERGPDVKAEALLEWIYRLQSEERDSELKLLIFTEFVPTQEMLAQFLTERGFKVVCLNGSMGMEERRQVQEAFSKDARVLVSTDAGGEGLNLQFCHVVVNFDIPWNPMRLEQRIGRVDRIGQSHVVRAINFVFEGSVEHRVQEVLEEKLSVIYEEFGIDKTGDVLDSAQAGKMFDELYIEALVNPDNLDYSVNELVGRIRTQAEEAISSSSILGVSEEFAPYEAKQLMSHPLPHWVESMTTHYLNSHKGQAENQNGVWKLIWPNGDQIVEAVFTSKAADEFPSAWHVTLKDPKIRGLAMRLPRFVMGQPIPIISIPNLSGKINGLWSLWRISLQSDDWNQRKVMSLFINDKDQVFLPTARNCWEHLLTQEPTVQGHLSPDLSINAYNRSQLAAEKYGQQIYEDLKQAHQSSLRKEIDKGEYAFSSRRRLIEKIGLPQVRDYRLKLLSADEKKWRSLMNKKKRIMPEMAPLIIVQITGLSDG